MNIRRTFATGVALATLTLATGCAGDELSPGDGAESPSGGGEVTIATQDFDEANLVTAMYEAVLEDAGYTVTVKAVGTRDIYMADFPQSVDVVPEYIAGISDFVNKEANGVDAPSITTNHVDESVAAVEPLLADKRITLLDASEATSQNAYFVTQAYADSEGVTSLSDLKGKRVVLAAAPDCEERADCGAGLTGVYGIDITEFLPLGFASPQTYQAVLDGEAQVGQTGTLDGTLESQGLVLLEDDQGIQPAQNLIPAVSADFLAEHADVEELLNALMAALDNDTLAPLIARVSVDREKAEDVAREFLETEGLL